MAAPWEEFQQKTTSSNPPWVEFGGPPLPQKPQTTLGYMGEMASNVPGDFVTFIGDMAKTVTSPQEVGKNLYKILEGGPERTAFLKYLDENFGSMEKFGNFAKNHPVQTASIIAPFFQGAGVAAKMAGATKVASALSKTSEFVEPISLASKGIAPVVSGIEKVGAGSLGASTGKGTESVKLLTSPTAKEYMRGSKSGEELVNSAADTLDVVKQQRALDYNNKLAEISKNDKLIDNVRTWDEFNSEIAKFGVKRDKNGKLNFKGSPLEGSGFENDIKKMDGFIQSQEDWTPVGMDTLKQKLGNFTTEKPEQANKLIRSVQENIKNQISETEPQYKEWMLKYHEDSKAIDQFSKALTSNDPNRVNTTLSKLTQAMREDPDFRRSLLQTFDERTGGNLMQAIAGYSFKGWLPGGYRTLALEVGPVLSVLGGVSPKMALAMASASPRLVGEFVNVLATGGKILNKAELLTRPVRSPAFMAGEVSEQVSNEKNKEGLR